jgi:hypothetical protein
MIQVAEVGGVHGSAGKEDGWKSREGLSRIAE